MICRQSNLLNLLLKKQSILLLGPRGTGKSTLINHYKEQFSFIEFDLLKSDYFSKYSKNPSQLAKEIEYKLQISDRDCTYVFIDEVQKIPILLDEVHRLIEKYKSRICFILSGSSARKLKTSSANLLAGRAVSLRMHPFSCFELEKNFNLIDVLQWGQLPILWNKDNDQKVLILKTYVDTYLREEIMQESIVRNIESFMLFLDLAAQLNGEIINYSKIGKQCGVSYMTIKEYFQILLDTLIAQIVPGWTRSIKKQVISAPKIYLFDVGVCNTLRGELLSEIKLNSNRVGKIFETFIINEIKKIIDLHGLFLKMFHWRSKDGHEVDLILSVNAFSKPIAIEIKTATQIFNEDIKSLIIFKQEEPTATLYCFCNCDKSFQLGDVIVMPWLEGLSEILKIQTRTTGY